MSNENKPIANSIKEQTYYKGKTAEVRKWAFAPQHAYLNSDSRSLRQARHASKCNAGNWRAVP